MWLVQEISEVMLNGMTDVDDVNALISLAKSLGEATKVGDS